MQINRIGESGYLEEVMMMLMKLNERDGEREGSILYYSVQCSVKYILRRGEIRLAW
jgi:hypothetical protein